MMDACYFVHMGGLCKVMEIALGGLSYRTICGMWLWDHREIPLIFSKMITNNAIRGITNNAIRVITNEAIKE